jgi:hypothetical protein
VRLVNLKAFTGTHVLTPPPPNVTVVLTDIDGFFYSTGSPSEFILKGENLEFIFVATGPSSGGPFSYRGKQMYAAPHTLTFDCVTECDLVATGWMLQGVSPYYT